MPEPPFNRPETRSAGPAPLPRAGRRHLAFLFLLAIAALLVAGYHPWAEDAEIYVPAVVQALHPADYPMGRQFFDVQTHFTLFTQLVAWSARLSHLPLAWVFFLWQLASIFLLLLACWKLASKCFPDPRSRWAAVALVAVLLTLPVAGTALYLLDQYFNPRSLSAFAVLFAIDAMLERKHLRAALWLLFTGLVHPLMAVFGISYLVLFYLARTVSPLPAVASAALSIPLLSFKQPSPQYLECLASRRALFLFRWHWYEWLGALAPLVLLWGFSRMARRLRRPVLEQLSASMAVFGLVYFIGAVIISTPHSLVTFIRFQPLRSLFLVYLFLVLFAGGFLGEFLLKSRPLRWLLLFLPLSTAMLYAQLQLFPGNRHIEWPGAAPENQWMQAFLWIRGHTPQNAVFALAPRFMAAPGEDNQGFRALAERSRLSDPVKDWGAIALFPGADLARESVAQVNAEQGWNHFHRPDFERLKRTYGVTWIVLYPQAAATSGFPCPYHNPAAAVCRVN